MTNARAPLSGIRVIDLGRHQAGPRCAQVLARLGAEVIKIERLGGEETRYHGPWVGKQSAYWVQYNSGKKSVSMDLRKDEAKEALRKLVKVSDVLVQNFRPGTIEKMGFGYDALKELNPRIIMANISAYGQFGPYRDQIGYDPIGQTMSGIAMVTGEEGMPPIRAGVPIIDRTTALHSAIGTLGALFERSVSGVGQSLDVCLADSGYSLTEIPITANHGAGYEPKRGESSAPPSGMYPCKDGWVLIAAGDQHHWPRVCAALGKPEWQDRLALHHPPRAEQTHGSREGGDDEAARQPDDEGRHRALHAPRRHRGAGEHHRAGGEGSASLGAARDGGSPRFPRREDRRLRRLLALQPHPGRRRLHAQSGRAQRGSAGRACWAIPRNRLRSSIPMA